MALYSFRRPSWLQHCSGMSRWQQWLEIPTTSLGWHAFLGKRTISQSFRPWSYPGSIIAIHSMLGCHINTEATNGAKCFCRIIDPLRSRSHHWPKLGWGGDQGEGLLHRGTSVMELVPQGRLLMY